ncbi:hypothetical protein [Acinetobacter indicus]|uniref:hypothetical protein n=1 Tax=Acinetobacter indicus TaxID=756892 RepID=UPI001443D21B|nr:hypothetical protein [Acinetobacter indicus]
MSNLTYTSWQNLISELIESHKKHNCSTANPIWMVQEKKITYGMDSGYADESKWIIDGDYEYVSAQELFDGLDAAVKHEVNGYSVKEHDELFNDLEEDDQDEILETVASELNYDWSKFYYVEDWVNVQAFLTRHDADRFIKRQSHHYGELRVYVESLWRSPQLKDLVQAILDGELKLIKGAEA